MDWDEFVARCVARMNSRGDLRNVWHPEPRAHLIHTDNGNLNVWPGEVRGQVRTGEKIDI